MKTDLENLVCYRVSVLLSLCGEQGPPKKDSGVPIDAAAVYTFGNYGRLEVDRR